MALPMAALAGICALATSLSCAQSYPAKPIRIIVPFPAGPSADFFVRLVANKMSVSLGQPIIVENRAGANGAIGSELVARAAPDGYTLLGGTSSTHLSAPFLTSNLPYDPIRDFTPVVAIADPATCIAVTQSLPVNSIKALIEHAQRNPGKLSFGSSGAGGFLHLAMEQFARAAKLDMVHIPYKGAAPAITDLSAGRIELAVVSLANARPLAAAGKVKILAMLDRYAGLPPDAPVLAEQAPGFEKLPAFYGLFAPAGLPRSIVTRLNAEAVKAIQSSDVRTKLDELATPPIGNSPEEFATMMKQGLEAYGKAIKAAGIKPE